MSKSLSFTVYPASADAEYLTVSDAMRQILDLVEVLEKTETANGGSRQIIWRLTDAHTNSPPFTVTAEAFPVNPIVSVGLEASRLTEMFGSGVQDLLDGKVVDWIDHGIAVSLRRILQRNLNGVGCTEIAISDMDPFNILPSNAQIAFSVLERLDTIAEIAVVDQSRTEYGAVEVEINGIIRWNDKPALQVVERLSRDKVVCILVEGLEEQLGAHKWDEVWQGRRLLVSGALHYGRDGVLKRISAETAEEMPWTDVSLSDLAGIDLLQGLSVNEHLNLMRDDEVV